MTPSVFSLFSQFTMNESPSRHRERCPPWPTTAAACFGGSSSCWVGCFLAPTRSPTAAATRCTSSTPTSPSGTSPSSRGTSRPLDQGNKAPPKHVFILSFSRPTTCLSLQALCVCDPGEVYLRVRGLGHARLLRRHVHVGPR